MISSIDSSSIMKSIQFVDGHLDIVNKSGETYYKCDPYYDADYRVANLHSNGSFELIHFNKLAEFDGHFIDAAAFINELIPTLDSNMDYFYQQRFKKFIFVGTMLGVHLNIIHSHIQSEAYLVVEDDFELFWLSLFVVDYTSIARTSKLFFAIHEFMEQATLDFLSFQNHLNKFIAYDIASEKHIELLHNITKIIKNNSNFKYPFSQYLLSFQRGIDCIRRGYNFLNTSVVRNWLVKYDILFIASGPSLKNNLEFIKSRQNNFLIVAIAASLGRL